MSEPVSAQSGLGVSGRLTSAFIQSPLTPLILLAAFALGLLALFALPREEEPQISVPLVDISIRTDGLKAEDAVRLVTEPLEVIVKAINGGEHVYSRTEDDRALVTARFLVGTKADEAILRVHEKVRANLNRIPVGIPEPLIVGRGIDDVAIVVLTLSPRIEAADRWQDNALYHLAQDLLVEVAKLDDVGLSYIVGGRPDQIRVEPDPERLALYGITMSQLVGKIKEANRSFLAGRVREANKSFPVAAGQTLIGIPDIGLLVIGARDGRPVYVRDVAEVVADARPAEHHTWHYTKARDGTLERVPAVSIAVAKRAGANAVEISERIRHRVEALKGSLVPQDVEVTVTRDYGETANEKANELLFHLALATISIVLLVGFVIGWRESIVVAIVIPITILMTLFASWLMGYTINRVSLFALIFSIGILVDDAIVVIENIARHWAMNDGRSRVRAAIEAVAEVGNPTIVATLTVVAALLPMLFVSGLMGPYMSPIPANASAAMLLSFFVAVIVTPWLMLKVGQPNGSGGHGHADHDGGWLGRAFRSWARPVIRTRRTAWRFLGLVGLATLVAMLLPVSKLVTVKLLPFDNKSELQVVVDLPRGTALETTDRLLQEAVARVKHVPEVSSIQAHAGTAAPFNFNGLVRHSYLRGDPEQGDLQINLVGKHDRSRTSHEIALDIRKRLEGLAMPKGTALKVVEVPPGPPVIATLLAEIYGPDAETRREVARKVRETFRQVPFIVDDDDSFGIAATRKRLKIDQDQIEFFKVEESDVYDTIQSALGGIVVGYSHKGQGRHPVEIAVQMPKRDLVVTERGLALPVPANALPGERSIVELGDVIRISEEAASYPIFRHNGRAAEMVMGELAGAYEAPVYGMLAVADALKARTDWGPVGPPEIRYHGQPEDEKKPVLLWDGEWEVTYITFRDMGAAFAVALLGIYILVVAQFRSFVLPLVILTPVPLTLIGIMIGHWLFGAPFSATSMIGFIALAGIIVRNSILLVDFIRHAKSSDMPLREVLLEAGAIRFKPILLTAVAAMIGAAVILFDPIFQGLAISLLFGLVSSTLLTVLVIPAVYIVMRDDGVPLDDAPDEDGTGAGGAA